MPTADQRLDQLEPLFGEMLAKIDETSAKVERVSAQTRRLSNALVQLIEVQTVQSDNIQFLLNKTERLEEGQLLLGQEMQELRQGQQELRQAMDERLDKQEVEMRSVQQQLGDLNTFLREKLK